MAYEIDFGKPPAGYAVTAARNGEDIAVQQLEFTSTEDGQHFIERLEGLPSEILSRLDAEEPIRPPQVDSMLAIVRPDGTATVYVNEVRQRLAVRSTGPIKKGATVTKDDIADVDRLELGVDIPADAGVLFLFSVGWRKGLFYDFGPLGGPDPRPRQYDTATMFGQVYCHVLFQERFSISDLVWDALFTSKWFPFVGLRNKTIDALLGHVRADWDPDEITSQIISETKDGLPQMLDAWRGHTSLVPHIEILERAAERFQEGDYVSCTGLLFPRIEGILRTHHRSIDAPNRPSPDNLTETAVVSKIDAEKSLLLPHKFAKYLREVYFANFNPGAHEIDVSRHSVAHGVAATSEFNQKSAVIAILVVHQLFFFLEQRQEAFPDEDVVAAQS